MTLILSRADIQRCFDMPAAIEATRTAFLALYRQQMQMSQRAVLPLVEPNLVFLMPSLLQTSEQGIFSLKVLTSAPGNGSRGLPRSSATVFLVDALTGLTVAILEGGWLTAARTGAVSGLASSLMARAEADVLALFGAGTQAPMQVWAIHTVRPLREVRVVNRDDGHYQQLIDSLHQLLGNACPPLVRASTAHEALAGASLVACATVSTTPLFAERDIAPGTHINAIGAFLPAMCEVDGAVLARSRIVVDQRSAALVEAGDLIQALERKLIPDSDAWLELAQIVSGEQPGRRSSDEITCFKSVGLAAQDLAVAQVVYQRAREVGAGIEVEL